MRHISNVIVVAVSILVMMFLKGCATGYPNQDVVYFPANSCDYWIEYRWDHGMGVVENEACVTLPGVTWVAARCISVRVDELPGNHSVARIHERSDWIFGEYGSTCAVCNPKH